MFYGKKTIEKKNDRQENAVKVILYVYDMELLSSRKNTSNIRMNVVIFCFSSSCVRVRVVAIQTSTADVPANCENQFCMVFDFSGMEVSDLRSLI